MDVNPSDLAMKAAVELEVHGCIGRVTTRSIGSVIQKAIDEANEHLTRHKDALEDAVNAKTSELYPDLRAENERLRAALQEIVRIKGDTLGSRDDDLDPPAGREQFDRGCRMAFYRCAKIASDALEQRGAGQ